MTRPLSSLGAPAESSSAPENPITIHEVSRQDAETFWTEGTDARSAAAAADSDLLMALVCRLIFAARGLALSCILTSDYRPIGGAIVPDGNQVCSGCAMHSHMRTLSHTDSCRVGEVLSILDRMQASVPSRIRERKLLERPSSAEAEAASLDAAGKYGEPWRYRDLNDGRVHVENRDELGIAALLGLTWKAIDHAERVVACVNVCAGIPTELLLNEKPLADLSRDVDQVIAVGRLLPGLDRLRTSQGVAR